LNTERSVRGLISDDGIGLERLRKEKKEINFRIANLRTGTAKTEAGICPLGNCIWYGS
jgi:hypothetical protein